MSDITRGARYAVAVLLLLPLLLAAANLLWTSHEVNVNNARQAADQARVAAAKQHAGQLVEDKLCASIGTMARLQPPAGSAAANPSRAYEQAEHRAWLGLESAIGCKETP